ncbi:MAG: NADH-quinone oxidoreductase subunit L [Dehalococcoidia bacterium]
MIPDSCVWLIIFLPVIAVIINGLFFRPLIKEKNAKYAGYITIGAIAGSLILTIWALISVVDEGSTHYQETINTSWFTIGDDFEIVIGLMVDKLSVIMALVVGICSLMIQIYGQGYMHGDTGYMRYYTFMALFTAAMLGVALAGSLLFTFICWELVGLSSYLLIGFWYHKPSAAAAAKKAFIVTRLADIGFVVALVGIWNAVGTFDIAWLNEHGAPLLSTWILLGLFAGAAGKSGQFPLHVWLPDAMEGPTPVSALIHSSTMVCAGVFLVARLFDCFAANEAASLVVAGFGGFTAIFAASMGMVMYDIKRVLAYSTLSQLGYMMLGLGAVAYGVAHASDPHVAEHLLEIGFAVGMFHLFTHAFFKSLLFLASGSLQHSSGTFDMRYMGGMRKHMPWTFLVFLIASLALAGIWPLSGFFSKDGILLYAWEHTPIFFWLAMITVFMTAFYMFRAIFMTFFGEFRGGDPSGLHHAEGEPAPTEVHPHESPFVMVGPMLILCALAVCSGWAWVNGMQFLGGHEHGFFSLFTDFEMGKDGLPIFGLLLGLFGIFVAWMIYHAKWISDETVGAMFKPIRTLWFRKYYMDELYEDIIVRGVLLKGIFWICAAFDTYIVDGIVNGAASLTRGIGGVMRKLQTGQLQEYGVAMGIGLVVVLVVLLIGFYQ